jgi:peptidoglycan hydrolase CwlO-like protein
MNAVAMVAEPESPPGSVHKRQVLDMDDTLKVQVARLESDVQHILTDVADIKVELRRTNDRLDKLDAKIDGVDNSLNAKIDGLDKRLTDKIDGVRQELSSMKVWALGMYITLSSSLLFVMAKGFHWM